MEVVEAVSGLELEPSGQLGETFKLLARAAALNNSAQPGGPDDRTGSQTEIALLDFARRNGIDVEALRAASPPISVIERTPDRPWMATSHAGEPPRTIVKGAPEAVLERCSFIQDGAQRRPLSDTDRNLILRANDALAGRPARVLGFARLRHLWTRKPSPA
jgi:Ca2+-transporting ATPase